MCVGLQVLLDLEKERKDIARFDEEIATREGELGKKVPTRHALALPSLLCASCSCANTKCARKFASKL